MALWTITWTPSTGSAITLAGAASDCFDQPEAPAGVLFSMQDQVQTSPVIRASQPRRFARSNRLVTASFTVNRSFSDFDASLTAALAHVAAFTTLGTVVITDGTASRTIYNADVIAEGGALGAINRWSYRITGTLAS